ncbi:MAG: NADH-quinone oxidoreductase subunit M [Candidatus Bathyarchaeota archaeon]|jgi:proton-translocating NADH-quinone oxidoreductase chain N|nr:NADH-quinone oxidoreductase subunit M [Candidatus Bathyarchaeota archaeon]
MILTWPIDILVLFAVTTPIAYLAGTKLRVEKLADTWSVIGFIFSIISLYFLYQEVSVGRIITYYWAGQQLRGVAMLKIDMLGVFMAGIFLFIGLLTAIYSVRYMEHDSGHAEYYTLLLLMVSGMVGVAFAGDFFTFFLFWELMCITSYVLVAFRKEKWEPIEAGFKYFVMSSAGSATVLFAMSILYGMTGSLNFAYLSTTLSTSASPWSVLAMAMIVTGLGVKAAIVPFHSWLPDAHPAAPSSISAMLSGVVIKTGVYGLVRIMILVFAPDAYHWQFALAILAVLTMTVGNLMALLQSDLKRLLAFSSIGHIGYILFGLSAATIYGLTGGLFHVMNHAMSKALLFLCSGAFLLAIESRNLDDLAGIGRKMKITGLVFIIGALALAGVPPLNGFQSEFMILLAGIQNGAGNGTWYWLSAIMIMNILFSVAYYLRLVQILILKEPSSLASKAKEAPMSMLFPMVILAIMCIIVGVYPGPFVDLANKAAQAAFNLDVYVKSVVG